MTKNRKGQARPPIQIRESDAERISNLALNAEARMPQVADLLLKEIDRARLVRDDHLPPDIVGMNCTVTFVDDASRTERTLQLVYPHEADIEAGRISIISLVGAGLIGLRAGQSISWPDREGHERLLRIIDVTQG
ncbi:nucleoside diphosphate kinase regulator [Alteraurantiacibacter buctensis]|uniref:Nucleoside diphosphate kinase regulator n=1 Tax=Alteraurantiacibacter buctensis TaxID=1503981 RepID=A0A844Z1F2_9SPHN|nr:nucleoside diphosphate kinase regulator [Alteraurantiacibacter buctensis]MXO72980.1 nucleoside diphosphate kinase regulator [Alteraurantiacibacter buctensis]